MRFEMYIGQITLWNHNLGPIVWALGMPVDPTVPTANTAAIIQKCVTFDTGICIAVGTRARFQTPRGDLICPKNLQYRWVGSQWVQ